MAESKEKGKEEKQESGTRKSVPHRFLEFIEHPLFTLPVGTVGGIVGILWYSPVLAVCGACVLLAFHRAGVVAGEAFWKIQVPAYFILCSIVVSGLYGLRVLIERKLTEENISLSQLVASAVVKILPVVPPQPSSQSTSPSFNIPISRRDSIAVLIPFAIYQDRFGMVSASVPRSDNIGNEGLSLTYGRLSELTDMSLGYPPHSPTEPEMWDFLCKALQYYMVRLFADLGNPPSWMNLDGDRGMTIQKEPAITVPDDKQYPEKKMKELFETSDFFGRDGFNWQFHKLHAPSGTVIALGEERVLTNWWQPHIPPRTVTFEREKDFTLVVGVTPKALNLGFFPQDFSPAPDPSLMRTIKTRYTFEFTVSMDFEWRGDSPHGQIYSAWIKELFAGYRKHLSSN